MTPTMTREQALAKAKELLGPRGDVVALGNSRFVGRQTGPHVWDWIGHGLTWEQAIEDVKAQLAERKKTGEALKEKFARIPTRVEGNKLFREWRGATYEVIVLPNDGGYEFAGVTHKSLTSIAKTITNAKSINGRAWFGVASQKETA